MMTVFVPVWKDQDVTSIYSLESANILQKQYYSAFKMAFLDEQYLDVKDNINYLRILMYDFENDFKHDHNYEVFCKRIDTLVSNYPIMLDYKNHVLICALLDVIIRHNWKCLPILDKIAMHLTTEMGGKSILVKSINWILEYLNLSLDDNRNIHILNVQLKKILRIIGFGIVPNGEIEHKDFTYGDMCVIYKLEIPNKKRALEQEYIKLFRLSKTEGYRMIDIFVKLAAKVILEDEILPNDMESIDYLITQQTCYIDPKGMSQNVLSHLRSLARWRLVSKKSILDKTMKKFIMGKLSSEQREVVIQALLVVACNSGYIRPNRVESLKKILPLFGIESQNVHSLIHRLLTDNDGFAVIEKKSESIEFSINENSKYQQNNFASKFMIDPNKLQIFETQTKISQALLSDIFNENEPIPVQNTACNDPAKPWMAVLKTLLSKETWNRGEVDGICREQGLMLGAILEQINDYAYEKVNDTIIDEDDDNIYVLLDYKEQLI